MKRLAARSLNSLKNATPRRRRARSSLTAADWPARRVGVCYNGRQGMGAGIKESKGTSASWARAPGRASRSSRGPD